MLTGSARFSILGRSSRLHEHKSDPAKGSLSFCSGDTLEAALLSRFENAM